MFLIISVKWLQSSNVNTKKCQRGRVLREGRLRRAHRGTGPGLAHALAFLCPQWGALREPDREHTPAALPAVRGRRWRATRCERQFNPVMWVGKVLLHTCEINKIFWYVGLMPSSCGRKTLVPEGEVFEHADYLHPNSPHEATDKAIHSHTYSELRCREYLHFISLLTDREA